MTQTSDAAPSPGPRPPVAPRVETIREVHGDRFVDAYNWLRQTDSQAVLDHLAAERAYYDTATAHHRPTADRLFAVMKSRVPAVDNSVPGRLGAHAYLDHTPAGADYPQLLRVPIAADAGDDWRAGLSFVGPETEVVVDHNLMLDGSGYLEFGLTQVSPDERTVAYSVDTTGDEVYRLRFRDAGTGRDLTDQVDHTYYGGAWSHDSSTFFYTVHDEKYRPFQVWRHRLGTDVADDVLVLAEPDERFDVEVRLCRSGDVIEIAVLSRDTTEVWLVDATRPDGPARLVQAREHGVEYRVEHARTPAGDRLLITTNHGAEEYRLMSAPLETPDRSHWTELVPEDPAERLYTATAFAGHVVTTIRRQFRLMARAYRIGDDGRLVMPGLDIAAQVAEGSVELADNDWFDAGAVTVAEQSYTSPQAWYDVDLTSGARTLVQRRPAPGYDESGYVSELVTVPVDGGVEVPVTIVRRTSTPLDGSAPCLLYGYGAYEATYEPEFDVAITALLDEGVVYAYAGIRGGGEGGRRWWLDGRLDRKQNTFSDHIAVADHLAAGLVDGTRIVTRGLSAGGLLQGAVFNQRPDRWAGVIAEVPFVDVVTTMLDGSIPLTICEWDEWGDPSRPEDYAWLTAYSPYDNPPPPGSRPDLFVSGALHDPRVMVFEPAKWVAKLRETDPDWSPRCVFRCELGAGAHVGPSGRFGHLHYEAEVYAWALARLTP